MKDEQLHCTARAPAVGSTLKSVLQCGLRVRVMWHTHKAMATTLIRYSVPVSGDGDFLVALSFVAYGPLPSNAAPYQV